MTVTPSDEARLKALLKEVLVEVLEQRREVMPLARLGISAIREGDSIMERLSYELIEENRNRKPLKRSAFEDATWELRFGPDNTFRVFYDVKIEPREVHILATRTRGSGNVAKNTAFRLRQSKCDLIC